MKFLKHLPTYFVAALVLTIVSCDPKEAAVYPPEANFFVSPVEGNTTTMFSFNSESTEIDGTVDTMLFFRWDWNDDGVWDTHFSKSKSIDHRFWNKGNYTVVMEASSNGGLRDTISTEIIVIQGNSAPHPVIIIEPGSGHIQTLFTMDASESTDDEDSIDQLSFRWDFEGDGYYDTEWSSNSIIEHRFLGPNRYSPTVQVRDPKGLQDNNTQILPVGLNNPDLVVVFTWSPTDGSTADTYTFDASESYDPADANNTFTYRWDLNADGFYDTEKIGSATFDYQFDVEGPQAITLEITDQYGLINTTTKELFVSHANRDPVANFFAAVTYGNTTTNFFFDASGVSDHEDYEYNLEVRWDFDSDGTWDTDYAVEKTATHKYGVAGEFTITMEVKDSEGSSSQATTSVSATTGTYETGLAIDADTKDHYGTIKIGTQWWFAENLKHSAGKSCYQGNLVYCGIYGGMYSWTSIMAGSSVERTRGLCPQGWHIPSVAEWQTLFNFFGEENARVMLDKGSETDFNMNYPGQINTSGQSEFAGKIVNYWTSTKGAGDNGWAFSMQSDKNEVWKLSLGMTYKNSVRCIKN